ncbi:hypothetical protein EAG_02097 [Camponotus floridanus]|uniref:Uncharacterized protein n=1 Tax=Camponotus floridanus TaxID=104421 RepID=E2B1M9_CAMFO|nr:hypothetical protein EAG_02097 [Camponotus floridanus]
MPAIPSKLRIAIMSTGVDLLGLDEKLPAKVSYSEHYFQFSPVKFDINEVSTYSNAAKRTRKRESTWSAPGYPVNSMLVIKAVQQHSVGSVGGDSSGGTREHSTTTYTAWKNAVSHPPTVLPCATRHSSSSSPIQIRYIHTTKEHVYGSVIIYCGCLEQVQNMAFDTPTEPVLTPHCRYRTVQDRLRRQNEAEAAVTYIHKA